MQNQSIKGFFLFLLISLNGFSQHTSSKVFPGADQKTPALAQYESWINNTNEGSTEAQTLINLDFFRWLKDEYGLQLDVYAISAGAIDKAQWYGSMDSEDFKKQFPRGFDPIHSKASQMGTRLGTWGGPDGFGQTPEEEKARIDLMVKLCRDYNFRLLKFDAVVGQLRNDKQDAFIRMMTECRKYSPDLILNNHRLNLNEEAKKHVTTTLWGGVETYVDVHISNDGTAPHHRGGNLARDVVPGFERLIEDHGVCLSSCLDYWEDDLVLQAFNRTLVLSPHLYGNPWFLRDDEYPKLARIFNLARKYGDILVNGMVLPEAQYGEKAISRGNANTRLITLRNLSWNKSQATITVGAETGLTENIRYEARLLHPVERSLGTFRLGETFVAEVDPFRSALLLICPAGQAGTGIDGCDYELISDVPGKPIHILLKGLPGTRSEISLRSGKLKFSRAEIDRIPSPGLLRNRKTVVNFPGEPLKEQGHRKLGELTECAVPEDAEALYEATVFSADNNALEIRSLNRSGETKIPEVKAAREAFLNQPLFAERGVWDKYLFDGDLTTSFYVRRSRSNSSDLVNGGSLRIDFGKPLAIDELIIEVGSEYALQPWKTNEAVSLQVSANLKDWTEIKVLISKSLKIKLDPETPVRYVRFNGTPDKICEITGFLKGVPLNRDEWRSSNLFSGYRRVTAQKAWSTSTVLNEIPKGSYLAVCLNGEHGIEGAYAAVRVDGQPVGAFDRSPSYPTNPWEYPVIKSESNYTYYVPLTADMKGKKIDLVVLGMKGGKSSFKPEAWLTCYPTPYVQKELILYR